MKAACTGVYSLYDTWSELLEDRFPDLAKALESYDLSTSAINKLDLTRRYKIGHHMGDLVTWDKW